MAGNDQDYRTKAADARTENGSGTAPDPLAGDRGSGARSHGWRAATGRDEGAAAGSPDARTGGLGPVPATGPRDLGADELQPMTSGDGANTGPTSNREPLRHSGGGTLRGNVGDTGGDAGEGSIDATDATSVTGDPDLSPAVLAREDGQRGGPGPGTIEGANDLDTGYRQGGASGALGPEDTDVSDQAAVDPTGPAATDGTKGDPRQHGRDTGLGGAQFLGNEPAGRTNVRSDEDDRPPM